MLTNRRTFIVAAMALVFLSGFARSAQSQSHSFVFDFEFYPTSESTLMAAVGYSDYSSCGHSGYWHQIDLWTPNGNYAMTAGYSNTQDPLAYDGDGDYPFQSVLEIDWCSCGGGYENFGSERVAGQSWVFNSHFNYGGDAPNYFYYLRDPDSANRKCAKPSVAWNELHPDGITIHGLYGGYGENYLCLGICQGGKNGVVTGPIGEPSLATQNCGV